MIAGDDLSVPNCPTDLVRMVVTGDAADGSDARWRCPVCGLTKIA